MMRSTSSPVPTGTVDLVDDDRIAVRRARDFARRLIDVGQVGMAVAAPRGRADRDEHRVGVAHGLGQVGREGQAALAHVVGDEIGQPRLEDRHLAALQRVDLGRVLVDAGDDVPEIGKTRARDQANIPAPDHRNPHESPISVFALFPGFSRTPRHRQPKPSARA